MVCCPLSIHVDAAQAATFNAGKPLTAGKTVITYTVMRRTATGERNSVKVTLTDDGLGKLLRDGVQVGTIDYAAGSGSFAWAKDYTYTITALTAMGKSASRRARRPSPPPRHLLERVRYKPCQA